jgi:hypothetical protein
VGLARNRKHAYFDLKSRARSKRLASSENQEPLTSCAALLNFTVLISLRGDARHATTFFHTVLAGFRAGLAVIVLVPTALVGADVADIGAHAAT